MWGARGPFLLAAAMVVAVVMPVVFYAKATKIQKNAIFSILNGKNTLHLKLRHIMCVTVRD
jgi:hypothetical protein